MLAGSNNRNFGWLHQPRWLFICGSVVAAVVALLAEGPGDYVGLVLLCICVGVISLWSLFGNPSLRWTVVIVCMVLLLLGWTVEEPESALFQSILITAAVGWRIDRLSESLLFLSLLALVPLIGSLGPNEAEWGWWNWTVGTVFTWSLGRVIRLLNLTLDELTDARAKLIDSAAREERLRISRDVHDLVGHSLTAMLLNIRAARRALKTDPAEVEQALADAERTGTTGLSDIRATLVDLRGSSAVALGQGEAFSSLPDGDSVRQLLDQQAHISVTVTGAVETLKGPVAVATYRVLQECITNISKHALTDSAFIDLELRDDELKLTSRNALQREKASAVVSEKSLGLISMRERITSLGGSFKAGTKDGYWQVDCRIPRYG